MRTVRIVSAGGDCTGTKVFDAATGVKIQGVESLTVHFVGAGELVRADIRIFGVEAELEAHPVFYAYHPRVRDLRQVSRIVFADGEALEYPDAVPGA